GAGGVRSDRDTVDRVAGSDTIESARFEQHGRPDLAFLLAAGAVLAVVGVLRIRGDDGSVAGNADRRFVFRDSAICRFESAWAMDGGRGGVRVFHGGAEDFSFEVESEADLGTGRS